ncbi:ABC transporter substrate-binding protein [Massilia pseudoviolaceinigra]|uniref:ABC transporter substrate-binding protein n=1 Tax=Massilia pseudoviolaceinigra TaxID=3057165 RepID=UPI002796C3FB|nr:ABC transporter substrate-binding protein [Massilia sp. CCM 9206]MDQ1919819.1 ABC transporter substrate-binding protein [Massilia sp. CCM 9206]
MTGKFIGKTIVLAALFAASNSHAQDVIRLGNLKFAHFGAVSYIKEIAPKCGIKVEERIFAKGLDVMQAIIAGELDVGATASEAAISGRASGAPIFVVAGFAKGGARLVARPDLGIRGIRELKGRKVGVTRGGIQEVLLMAQLKKFGMSADSAPGKDVHVIYLPFADLNQALMGRNIDAMMQSEPQSSQAINKGFGMEVMKPYDTPIGEPVRTMVMTEAFYNGKRVLADKFMRCFVEATRTFMAHPSIAEKYVREVIYKGQITRDDFEDAISNSPYSLDVTAEHIQITTDTMVKTGVGRMVRPPLARDWVRTDLLDAAKKSLGVR